jgi:hypothetical protein
VTQQTGSPADQLPGQLAFPLEHFHLAPFGHTVCHDPGCPRPHDDPADDMACTAPDPGDCDGTCAGGQHNAARRASLAGWPAGII